MKKGSENLIHILVNRGANRANPAKWCANRYGGCEATWRSKLQDPAKLRVDELRLMKLTMAELEKII